MTFATDILKKSRRDLVEVLEEMGAVAMHLSEALTVPNTVLFAVACVEDAQAAVDNAISELNYIRDSIGRWAAMAEASESDDNG
jgi:hypothetical protein